MSIFKKVKTFQEDVLRIALPKDPVPALDPKWSYRTTMFIHEELNELHIAITNEDRAECVDALIDIMYFSAGALAQLGIDGDKAFDLVHHANLKKRRGVKEGRGVDDDASKPDDWVAPDHSVWFE